MIRALIIVLCLLVTPAFGDQYYQSPNGALHFLSTDDIRNGGERLLPVGALPITAAQAAVAQQQQAAQQALLPNALGFQQAVKTALGGIVGANTLMVAYPAFLPALQQGQWADLQALIIDANTRAILTPAQYSAIKTAAAANNIPVTLP